MRRTGLSIYEFISYIALCASLFVSIWWFWGREPYVKLNGPWESVLVRVEPTWYGWKEHGLMFSKNVPPEKKEIYPDAQGWWYVRRQIAEIPDGYIHSEDPIEKSLEKLEKYYAWEPL